MIHKSLRDFRPLRYSGRDAHAEREHVNGGTDTSSVSPTLQVLDSSFLLCLSWLLRAEFGSSGGTAYCSIKSDGTLNIRFQRLWLLLSC
jgi:hypothetical protein